LAGRTRVLGFDYAKTDTARQRDVSGLLLSGEWLFILLSGVFYAFFWRVDNEPGAREFPALLWAAIFLFLWWAGLFWQAYLLPIANSLSAQGRMHEGDSDGCFYGLLYV
jgi:hypothetical protein